MYVTTIVLWVLYAIATLVGIDLAYNILSPLTGLSALLLIAASRKQAGKYRYAALFMMLGIAAWVIADIILFIYTYIDIDNPILIDFSDKL